MANNAQTNNKQHTTKGTNEMNTINSTETFRAWYTAQIMQKYPTPKNSTAQLFANEVVEFVLSMRDDEFVRDIEQFGNQSALVALCKRRPVVADYLKGFKKQYAEGTL